MSTQQPSGGGRESAGGGHQGEPAYAQPQDPWIGFDPGLASMPTDPIPQRPAELTPSDVWSSPTVAHGAPQQFPFPQQPRRNNVAVISVVVLLIITLGGGGAYAAYKYFSGQRTDGGTGSGDHPSATTTPTASSGARTDFPYTVKVGDCLVNVGTRDKPRMATSDCGTPGSFKVVRIATGASIPVGPKDTFDTDTTSAQVCAGIDFDTWYGYQVDDPNLNLFFCMTDN